MSENINNVFRAVQAETQCPTSGTSAFGHASCKVVGKRPNYGIV